MISIVFILVGIIIYLNLNKFYQFTVLSLSALLPLSFGDFISVPTLLFIEWLTIITFFMLIHELNPVFSSSKRIKIVKFKGIEVFIFALFILVALLVYNILQNEILSNHINTGRQYQGTKRLYFEVFNNILLFFTTIIFAVLYYDQINFEKFFKIILYLSVLIGVVRISSYFFKFDIPFLYGLFRYTTGAMKEYGGTAFRLSGLDTVSIIGIPAFFAYYIYKKKLNLIILFLLLVFVFLSGGRSVMAGVIISLLTFSFLFAPKNFLYLIITGGIFLLFFTVFVPDSVLQGQTSRLSSFNAGHFLGQDQLRGLAWFTYVQNFSESPLIGIGIGTYKGYVYSSFEYASQFSIDCQMMGGHGSYLSLLSLFGIAGLTYFIIMVFGGIFQSFRKIKQHINSDQNKTAISVFCFVILIIESVDWITSENGLNLPLLFFIVGFISSLTVLQNLKEQKSSTANNFNPKNIS